MKLNISDSLRCVGISPGDVVIVHTDAGVAAQLAHVDVKNRLNTLILSQKTRILMSRILPVTLASLVKLVEFGQTFRDLKTLTLVLVV